MRDEKYSIRPAVDADAEAIAAIYRPFVTDSHISFEETAPDAEEIRARLAKVRRRHAWLVAVCQDQVVAYAYASDFRERHAYRFVCEVSVYVHSDHRKKKVARKLYEELHGLLKEKGFTRSYAVMSIPNEASRNFHLDFGYRTLAVFHSCGFKFGRWIDTEWMERVL